MDIFDGQGTHKVQQTKKQIMSKEKVVQGASSNVIRGWKEKREDRNNGRRQGWWWEKQASKSSA